ncbi:type 1 glutamine amidotransferase [Georgenia subflava]|uniref:Type 1 glutamine amidotransferase n=1 Tax=Georgenia subflava TaxID=1622177 RepID=A0A6N7EMS2_9MICO|nr:type 1 glutamine amidotransferase [Georgenia subflava]MPV38428.1 type 1 glutamine amidotransferase [Georgenia subflava]
MSTNPTPAVLTVVQPDEQVPLDRFADWLDGVELRIVRPFAGEDVPGADQVGSGLLVLGGKMNAQDDEVAPWLPAVRQLLVDAVERGVPTLGICLGHQLLAEATGGRVVVAAPPGREAGIVEISWRAEAADDPVLGAAVRAGSAGDRRGASGLADSFGTARQPAMHADAVVELPPGAVWLAYSHAYPFQAMRLGSALGVQFHPEASPELLARWSADKDDVDTDALVAAAREHDAEVSAVGRAIAQAFAAQVRGVRRA